MTDERRPGADQPRASLALWDWRRQIADLYAALRTMEPVPGWELWRRVRDDLFRTHPQSPLTGDRSGFAGIPVFPYDQAYRVLARVERSSGGRIGLAHSGDGVTAAHEFGQAVFTLHGVEHGLPMYWLDDYAGGVFLPFRDATNGDATYGGGRYLLDTAKGADLGHDGDRVILDFNFAYHPSCAHDPVWSCPLPSPDGRLPVAITAGERL